jgi:hypothetical protein
MQLLDTRWLIGSHNNSLNRQVKAGGSTNEKGLQYPKYREARTSNRQMKVMRGVVFRISKGYGATGMAPLGKLSI